jgi:hypothetical protein
LLTLLLKITYSIRFNGELSAMANSSDNFFNDLTQSKRMSDPRTSQEDEGQGPANDTDNNIPRPKRIACIVCRKRKLRCDGKKPSCGTCSRLGHNCAYDEVRKKSGPKRGYVKQLEARLGMNLPKLSIDVNSSG